MAKRSPNFGKDTNLPREPKRSTVGSAMKPGAIKKAAGAVGAVKAGINRLKGR